MAERRLYGMLGYLRRLAGNTGQADVADSQLLERFVARHDHTAFESLVQRHAALVLGVCQRVLRHTQDAEDAFQATFLVLARKAAAIRQGEALGGWLHGVAYHIAIKARASAGRRREQERQVAAMTPADQTVAETGNDLEPLLDAELQRLPEKYREPLIRCYLEGKSSREVALELGWPSGSMSRRLERARELLRIRLRRRGVTLSAALLAGALVERASATVPESLARSAYLAPALAAGQTLPSDAFSSQAVSWAETALPSSGTSKMKLTLTIVAGLCLTSAGGAALQQILAARKAQPELAAHAPPAPPADRSAPAVGVRTDLLGDFLPPGAIARIGSIRWRHGGMSALAVAPDGKTVASAGAGFICLWEADTGKYLRDFPNRDAETRDLVFAPDGKTLASAGSYAVQLWDVATGKMLERWRPETENDIMAHSLAFSPDGRTLAWEISGTIVVFETATGRAQRQLETRSRLITRSSRLRVPLNRPSNLNALAFSGDGKTLTWLDQDTTLATWELATGKRLQKHQALQGNGDARPEVAGLALARDGKHYAYIHRIEHKTNEATTYEPVIAVRESATGKLLHSFPGGDGWSGWLAFSPDGKILASGGTSEAENGIRLWDLATSKQLAKLPYDAHRTPTDGFLSGPFGPSGGRPIVFTPDQKRLATVSGNQICIWDLANGKDLFPATMQPCSSMTYNADNMITLKSDTTHSYDPRTGKELPSKQSPEVPAGALVVSPGEQLMGHLAKGRLYSLCDETTGKQLIQMKTDEDKGVGFGVALSPDGNRLALADSKAFRVVMVPATEVYRPEGESAWLAFSADGTRVIAWSKGTVRLLDSASGQELHRPAELDKQVSFVTLSPDNRTLATTLGHSGPIVLYDLASGRETGRILTEEGVGSNFLGLGFFRYTYKDCTFSPNGKMLATRGLGKYGVVVFEVSTGQERVRILGHQDKVDNWAFSPDSKALATACQDSSVLIWDLAARAAGKSGLVAPRDENDLKALWLDLADADAAKAYRAIGNLARVPALSVPFLQARMRPVPAVDARRLAQAVADLANDRFAARQSAVHELEKLGELAAPALEKVLADRPPLDLEQRIEPLLNKVYRPVSEPSTLQALRGIEVLELIGTPQARQVLDALARGATEARVTREALASLQRVERKRN